MRRVSRRSAIDDEAANAVIAREPAPVEKRFGVIGGVLAAHLLADHLRDFFFEAERGERLRRPARRFGVVRLRCCSQRRAHQKDPDHAVSLPWVYLFTADAGVGAYGNQSVYADAFIRLRKGEIEARGKLPVSLSNTRP